MTDTEYYIVEARLPVQVNDAANPEEAARKGAQKIERQYGVDLSNWFLRVFKYGGSPDEIGPVEEYFSNPSGSKFREIQKNVERHNQLAAEGKTPDDV